MRTKPSAPFRVATLFRRAAGVAIATVLVIGSNSSTRAAEITNCIQVLSLPNATLDESIPVRITGVVTLHAPASLLLFVQDETAGAYVWGVNVEEPFPPGTVLELTGTVGKGLFAPIIWAKSHSVKGRQAVPEAPRASLAQVLSGNFESQWVEVEGVVRWDDEVPETRNLTIGYGRDRLVAWVIEGGEMPKENLYDRRVRVRGVAAATFGETNQLTGFTLYSPDATFVEILEDDRGGVFDREPQLIRDLNQWTGERDRERTQLVQGVVTYSVDDRVVVRDESGSIWLDVTRGGPVEVGDEVDAAGFVQSGPGGWEMRDVFLRSTSRRLEARPVPVKSLVASGPGVRNELVRVTAEFGGAEQFEGGATTLVLFAEDTQIQAVLPGGRDRPDVSRWEPGSRVDVTGIYRHERPVGSPAGMPVLLLRNPADVVVITGPPTDSGKTLAWSFAALLVAAGGGLWLVGRRRLARLDERVSHYEQALELSDRQLALARRENERVARDLHDNVIQSFYAIGLGIEDCRRLTEQQRGNVVPQLTRLKDAINHAIRDVRGFITGIEPGTIRGRELPTALKSLVLTMGEEAQDIFQFEVQEEVPERLTSHHATVLFLILKEAMSNAVRHGDASKIKVKLSQNNGAVEISVTDNGVGFNPDEATHKGHGLRNMSVRADELGAELKIDSQIDAGTSILVRLKSQPADE